ncbi:MAG TPA: sugar transferase [Rhodopila sp.]|jgi:exopolysaccharide biosynthesis polyprenyl glycosylphosphotransferase|nr:sugar transferase [Rhodopila sp.]
MRRNIAGQAKTNPEAVADNLPGSMALLGAIEFVLSFTVIYAVIETSGVLNALPNVIPAMIQALPRGPVEMAAILSVTLATVALSIGLYRRDVCRDRGRLMLAAVLSTAAAFTVITLLAGGLGRGVTTQQAMWIGRIVGAWVVTIGIIRLGLGAVTGFGRAPRRILILGGTQAVARLSNRLGTRLGRQFDPVISPAAYALDPAPGELDWPSLARQRLWGVVVASGVGPAAAEALLDCKLRGLRVLSGPDFQERNLGRIDLDSLTHDAFLTADGFAATRWSDRIKRVSDIAISLAMLAVTLPLMLITALAIKADSPGPVFYGQGRIGAFGRSFTVYKFRSMSADAEASGKPRWAQKQDPRVTRVGRFIRSTRIDELPQLINILRGEMTLVGPRPERPHFVDQLSKVIPFYSQRSYVKPGLTGWAQVNYPYGASIQDAQEKLAYDLYYVKHRSFWMDLRILVATVRVVLTREGAR